MQLNPPQLAAASHRDGPLLVFAGAGSGKTRVITQRIANLVKGGADPARVCAVTFTNKAAGEMSERLAGMLGEETAKLLTVSTFHALCVRLLRQTRILEWAGRRPGFAIYDERDAGTLLQSACEAVLLSADDEESPTGPEFKALVKQYSESLEKFIEDRNLLLERPGDFKAMDPEQARLAAMWANYEDAKLGSNAFDFSDLIVYGVRLVESPCELGSYARSIYHFLLVDEFQDTDELQLRLVKGLASNGNLCVVGDDDQCIYAWRGARIENIRGFRNHYPEVTVVKLEQNYRSSANVVAAAAYIIEQAFIREPKRMFTDAPAGEPIRVVECREEAEEARFICREVQRLLADGVEAASIAILYRNHATALPITDALRSAEIPFRVHGGFRWFDRAEVRDALALFKLVLNQRSSVDAMRSLKATTDGVGPGTVAKLNELARRLGVPLFEAMKRRESLGLRGAQAEAVGGFVTKVQALSEDAKTAGAATMVRKLLDESGLVKAYEAAAEQVLKDEAKKRKVPSLKPDQLKSKEREKYEAAKLKATRIEELERDALSWAERAKQRGQSESFVNYVEAVCLRADDREGEDKGVQLMTVHASKGLEFEAVFIPACEQEVFARNLNRPPPLVEKAARWVEDDETDPEAPQPDDGCEDDDRRLFYVAVTRAREQLCLLWAKQRRVKGVPKIRKLCPFVDDIPIGAMVTVEAKELLEQGASGGEEKPIW